MTLEGELVGGGGEKQNPVFRFMLVTYRKTIIIIFFPNNGKHTSVLVQILCKFVNLFRGRVGVNP